MSDQPTPDADQSPPVDPYATTPPAPDGKSTATFIPDEGAGTMIGPYKLLQPLGKGGMGVVWMAEQREPVQRYVAIKIIKATMSGDQVLARFEAERQALAMMDHPNIAKVLDAGATAAGRPYFVMELVKGVPFSKYCDQEKLTLKDRIDLFIPVCNAVQHAHQKGIIHRDLKPSNVLIALYDGKPVPKVIDFGVAKATHQKLTEKTMFTELGEVIGTLQYMSPEQAGTTNLDIDTRADIYSLGVMLYELLAGSLPLEGDTLHKMLDLIREMEPPKPSTKLSGSEELPTIAAKRKLEPKKLAGLVQGDLDWIVMKCLEKERARRYETANQLGQELQRYLADEPVQAGPPSASYRIKKFLRRNKELVVAASLIFVALTIGVIGTTIGLIQAQQAREDEKTQRELAQANEKKMNEALIQVGKALVAQKEATEKAVATSRQAEHVHNLVESVFGQDYAISPDLRMGMMGGMGGGATGKLGGEGLVGVRVSTEKWKSRLAEFANGAEKNGVTDPRARVRLYTTAGVALASLGDGGNAVALLKKAHREQVDLDGPDHSKTLACLDNLVFAHRKLYQFKEAREICEMLLAKRRKSRGENDAETIRTMIDLATIHFSSGRDDWGKGLSLLETAYKTQKEKLGSGDRATIETLSLLSSEMRRLSDHDPSPERVKSRVAILELLLESSKAALGLHDAITRSALDDLAWEYRNDGKIKKAIPLFEQARKLDEQRLAKETDL